MKKFEHFEHLWEAAEQISSSEKKRKDALYSQMQQAITEYQRLDQVPSVNLRNVLQTKKMGEMLYILSHFSGSDNINTFAALQTEVQIAENISQPTKVVLEEQELRASFA